MRYKQGLLTLNCSIILQYSNFFRRGKIKRLLSSVDNIYVMKLFLIFCPQVLTQQLHITVNGFHLATVDMCRYRISLNKREGIFPLTTDSFTQHAHVAWLYLFPDPIRLLY